MKAVMLSLLSLAATCGWAGSGELVLAERGKPAAYAIVVPSNPTPVLQYAAEELRDWTEQLTGVRLAIATNATPERAVYVGGATEEGLGTDGFRIRVEGESVRILGSSDRRGVLYGVYEILETYGGIGWFSSWHTVVPKTGRLAVPGSLDDRQVPAFEWREHFSFDATEHRDFAARIRTNNDWWWNGFPAKMGGGYRSCCLKLRGHSFYTLVPPEKYYDAHPEWFSEVGGRRLRTGGQLCLSNPEMTATAISNMLALVRAEPDCDYAVVAHNDCFNYCTCATCKAVDEAEGSPAGSELRFVNACAEALEREFPDKCLKFSAYQYTRVPPKITKPRRNVFVDFAPIETDYARPIVESEDEETVRIRRNIEGWGRIASEQGLFVFDYVANFIQYVMPYPNFGSLQKNVQFYHDNRTRYLLEEDDHCAYHGNFTELKAWLLAKWMWNPKLDGETLLARFLKGYYGAGAPFVRTYLDELNDLGRKSGVRLCCIEDFRGEFMTDAFVERSLALWDRAIEATKDDPACAYNVRMGKLGVIYLVLMRHGPRVNVSCTPAPTPRIRALAQEMLDTLELAERAGRPVTFEEGGMNEGRKDRPLVARWRRLADPARTMQPRDRFVAEAEDVFDVFLNYNPTKLLDDPAASGGKAYRMPNAFSGDRLAYLPMSALVCDPDAKCRIRVRVRAERKPGAPDGDLVSVGLGSDCAVTHRASEADGKYVWLDFVDWTPKPNQTLYLMPGRFDKAKSAANPAFEFLWIDQVEILRAK